MTNVVNFKEYAELRARLAALEESNKRLRGALLAVCIAPDIETAVAAARSQVIK